MAQQTTHTTLTKPFQQVPLFRAPLLIVNITMVHKVVLLSLLALVCLVHQGTAIVYPTVTFDGWDVIFLDQPSYLFYLQHSYSQEQLYIFGGNSFRIASTGNNFTVQDHVPALEWGQLFISLHVFHNGTDIWAIGPTNPSDHSAHPAGYDLPISLAGPDWHTFTVGGLQGFILYSVYVDDRNLNDILAYMVGWTPVAGQGNETVNRVALGVVRLHLNFNLPYAQRNFTFDYATDVVLLNFDQFSIYNSHYKPQLHYKNTTDVLIVVDPATNNIYTVQVGPGNTPMSKGVALLVQSMGTTISCSRFHVDTNLLYVGFAAEGTGNGSITAYSVAEQIIPQHFITFNMSLSNPRAIAIDEPTDTLYVGFNGGEAVVKLDYLLNIQGWQRVPIYLVRMEAAQVGQDHVYFITNEQHSKVVRVNKQNFCPQLCPWDGYCEKGKCLCDPLLRMSSDGKHCEIPKGTTDKGAATALGVLFAITFVVGAIGWLFFWRARKGGYVQV